MEIANCKLKIVNFKLQITDLCRLTISRPLGSRIVGVLFSALVVVPMIYVLSYAPFIRFRHGKSALAPEAALVSYDFEEDWLHGTHPFFAPVERLIDETWLAGPLRAWAGIWGCDQMFNQLRNNRQWNATLRRFERSSPTR
jgi:hypothetical protein